MGDTSKSNETYSIRTATPFARQRILLDYVIRHPGQSQNQIALGVRGYMTRRVAIKHLNDMVGEEIIIVQKAANGSAYGYFAQFNNPVAKIFQEVHKFEPAMRALVSKAASQIEFQYWKSPEGFMYQDMLNLQKRLRPIFDLFKYFVDINLYRATIGWRYGVTNEESRRKLYVFAIEAIIRIQEAMFEELRKAGMDRMTLGLLFGSVWHAVNEERLLSSRANQLGKIGLKKEALDVIEKMPKHLKRPKIVRSYMKVGGGKMKLIKEKRWNEDGSVTRLR